MKRVFVLLLVLVGTAIAQSNDLGVMLGTIGGSPQRRVEIAKQLSASWYRPEPVLLGSEHASCEDCEAARAGGLKLVLVVRNATALNKASLPLSDPVAYQQKLRAALDRYKPEIVVVENEPEDKDAFAGSPDEYATELKAACEVTHAANIKCTDGGLASPDLAGVVIDELWKTDKLQAADFGIATEIVRAKNPGTTISVLGRTMGGQVSMQQTVEKATAGYLEKHRADIDRSRAFLLAGASAGPDYANFHWYELKPEEVTTVLDVLGRLNKRAQMTDEIGQMEERPFETGDKIKILLDAGVRPIIWAGIDGKDKVGLVDKKGDLRPTGRAFQQAAQKGVSQ